LRARRAILAVVTAAGAAGCSIPEKQQYPPFGCNGQPLPTTAPDPITIRGRVVNPVTGDPYPGAMIEVFRNGQPFVPASTRADGTFVIHPRTGGQPLDAFFQVSQHAGENPRDPNLDTYFYPAAPLTDDLDIGDLQILTGGLATNLMTDVQINLDLSKILLAITVVDCNDVPQGGAMVSTDPKGAPVRYVVDSPNGPVPSLTATVTDRQSGTGFAANVPITDTATGTSTITLGASMPLPTDSSHVLTLRGHSITGVKPGVLIQAEIQP
jgi:hypothetical protein